VRTGREKDGTENGEEKRGKGLREGKVGGSRELVKQVEMEKECNREG